MIELGFLLMYRYRWSLSTGNLVTGVLVNFILVRVGAALLGEKINKEQRVRHIPQAGMLA
jgi:hypothetical protein